MDMSALRAALDKRGVDPLNYRILDAPDEATWCIRKQGKTWLVFYFERGTKWELQRFSTEASACEHFGVDAVQQCVSLVVGRYPGSVGVGDLVIDPGE